MKTTHICMMLLSATTIMASTEMNTFDHIVSASKEHLPVVWETIKKKAKEIPLTKRQAWKKNRIDPQTGRQY